MSECDQRERGKFTFTLPLLQPKKVKKAEVQMMYSDSQKLVRGERIS